MSIHESAVVLKLLQRPKRFCFVIVFVSKQQQFSSGNPNESITESINR